MPDRAAILAELLALYCEQGSITMADCLTLLQLLQVTPDGDRKAVAAALRTVHGAGNLSNGKDA